MSQWGKQNSVNFYLENRCRVKDLYPSEINLLKKIKKKTIVNILDLGCATGGFYEIFIKLFNKKIKYHGLDIEKKMILNSKKRFSKNKNIKFDILKNMKLNQKNSIYDLVFSTGTLNHNKNYKTIINEMLRVSKKYIFIDSPRVHFGKDFISNLDLTKRFPSNIKKKNLVNNYTINLKDYLSYLKKSLIKNKINKTTFYFDNLPYKKRYLATNKKIYFLTILCEKTSQKNKISNYNFLTKNKKAKKLFLEIFKDT